MERDNSLALNLLSQRAIEGENLIKYLGIVLVRKTHLIMKNSAAQSRPTRSSLGLFFFSRFPVKFRIIFVITFMSLGRSASQNPAHIANGILFTDETKMNSLRIESGVPSVIYYRKSLVYIFLKPHNALIYYAAKIFH